MTSIISQYRETELAIKELQARLQSLSKDERLQGELEFEGKLRALMGEYGKSLKDVISMLNPDGRAVTKSSHSAVKVANAGARAARRIKQYKNPHNGEVIETKGGNHIGLKAWKTQYGNDVVESWATVLG